ncbi:hypothetical protein RMCBS344292_17590 [Rhizopus microsporus]|nr:hypothetical protein RMCBS344292_17590 [Rhizopus microsporus]
MDNLTEEQRRDFVDQVLEELNEAEEEEETVIENEESPKETSEMPEDLSTPETYDIVLEKEIIDNLVLGMVARVTLCKLSNGEWYLEKATRIMPSFYMEDDCLCEEDYDY